MNDQLFEMLLSLFEQALTKLKHHQKLLESSYPQITPQTMTDNLQHLQDQTVDSMRVLTIYEQVKLTKPAHQFLIRLMQSRMLSSVQFEQLMHQVLEHPDRYVTVNDLAMVVHQDLSESLSSKELMMLEFMFDAELENITKH